MSDIFYRTPLTTVSKEITARQYRYGARSRAPQFDKNEGNSFVGGKTAYAVVKSINATSNATLGQKRTGFDSLYSGTSGDGDNIKPRPVLTSVTVNQDGDIGTIQKCVVNWKVFSKSQLLQYDCNFLSVGTEVEITYGWSAASGTANTGTFKGSVYNIGYTLDKDGGFNCNFEAVGPGFNTLGLDPNSIDISEPPIVQSETVGAPAPYNGMAAYFASYRPDIVTWYSGVAHGSVFSGKIVAYQLKLSTPPVPPADGTEPPPATEEIFYYTTLKQIFIKLNEKIKKTGNELKYDELYGHGNDALKSPAPQILIFPGGAISQGDYTQAGMDALAAADLNIKVGPKGSYNITGGVIMKAQETYSAFAAVIPADVQKTYDEAFAVFGEGSADFDAFDGLSTVSLEGIQININALQAIQNKIAQFGKSNRTFKTMLEELFNLVRDCSGGIYDIVAVEDDDDPKIINIVNRHWTKGTPTPIVFKPFGIRSCVRDMQLSSKLPDSVASVAYVTAKGAPGMESEMPDKLMGTVICDAGLQKAPDISLLEERINNLGVSFGSYGWALWSGIRKFRQYDPSNFTYQMEGDQKTAAAWLSRWRSNQGDKWNANPSIPLNLSVTLDGINGFRFGDVVTTDYMLPRYEDTVVFTVTKVNHTISGQDWTTQIETVCRMKK